MSIRTDRKKEMYRLHQSLGGEVEPIDSNSLETALRELRKETALKIHYSRAKWIGNDLRFNCNIYVVTRPQPILLQKYRTVFEFFLDLL